jgi:hypothetical protein
LALGFIVGILWILAMFYVCELQHVSSQICVPKNIDAASNGVFKRDQVEWSKENRLGLAQIGKKWPRHDPASRRNLNGLRLPPRPRQPEHFYYRAGETASLKLVL